LAFFFALKDHGFGDIKFGRSRGSDAGPEVARGGPDGAPLEFCERLELEDVVKEVNGVLHLPGEDVEGNMVNELREVRGERRERLEEREREGYGGEEGGTREGEEGVPLLNFVRGRNSRTLLRKSTVAISLPNRASARGRDEGRTRETGEGQEREKGTNGASTRGRDEGEGRERISEGQGRDKGTNIPLNPL
jgi:hypothetical protein